MTWGKVSALVSVITALYGAWFFMEDHFALADDLAATQVYARQVESNSIQTIKDLRIQMISEQLNDLDAKEKFSAGGLTSWDTVRKINLQRQWELLTK